MLILQNISLICNKMLITYQSYFIIQLILLSYYIKIGCQEKLKIYFMPCSTYPFVQISIPSENKYLSSQTQIFFINYHYNFQMMQQKYAFLFVLFLFAVVHSRVLTPISYCFGNCLDCEPNNLAFCKGPSSCEWGFYRQNQEGPCIQSPPISIIRNELGVRSNATPPNISKSWGDLTKQTVCEYVSPTGKQYIDALGFYTEVTMIEKTYDIERSSDIFFLSFNLLRNDWEPFSDFMLVDITSGSETIGSLQISYQSLTKVDTSPTNIICGGQEVISQKFNIKIINNQKIGSKVTVVITSFLHKSKWALSNIKFITACSDYSIFDASSQSCTLCDPDSYLTIPLVGQKWCQKCPNLCKTCESKNKCTTCLDGAIMDNNNLCSFPENIKTQQLALINNTVTCGKNYSFYMGSQAKQIVFPEIRNQYNNLYDEIQLQFTIFYSPADWTASSNSRISVQVNTVEIFSLDYQNLTNKGVAICNLFTTNQMASIEIVSPLKIHNDNSIQLQFSLAGKNSNVTFGVSNVMISSLVRKLSVNNSTIKTNENETQKDLNQSTLAKGEDVIPSIQPQTQSVLQPTDIQNSPKSIILSNNQSSNIANQPKPNNTQDQLIDSNTKIPDQTTITPQINKTDQLKSNSKQTLNINQQSAINIFYVPSSSHQVSGIQVVVTNISKISSVTVAIDKLNSNSYQIVEQHIRNNNLYIFLQINQSFIGGVLTVYNATAQRLLQTNLKNSIGTVQINRFDALSANQLSAISSFAIIFAIFSWIAAILIIIAVLIGYGVVVQEYVLSLQLIFLHVYISSDCIPLTFRDVIAGLNIIENLNYFVPQFGSEIQNLWLGNVVQNGPIQFFLYNTDINFSRQFYPIIFINIFYALWFIGIYFLRKYLYKKDIIQEEKTPLYRAIDNIADRLISFVDQIVRYQFLATIWLCFVQFYNLIYPQDSNRSQVMNTILCFCAFFCTLGWQVLSNIYTRRYYYENEYADYLYNFQDICYKKIPRYYLPTIHHRYVYPIMKVAKLFFIALFIAYAGTIGTLPLLFLLVSNILEIWYLNYFKIYSDSKYLTYKIIENILFVIIDFVLLILINLSSLASTESYVYVGFFLSGFSFLVVVNSLLRMGYLGKCKYIEMFNEEQQCPLDENVKHPQTLRVV